MARDGSYAKGGLVMAAAPVVIGNATLYCGDCLEVLPTLGKVDAVVTDPPYGMKNDTDSTRFTGGDRALQRNPRRSEWGPIRGDAEDFDPARWLEYPRVVLWGSNHYAQRLPKGTTLVWLKKADHLFGKFLSDCEIGWMKGGHGVYAFRKTFGGSLRYQENDGLQSAHPTQKPIALMQWCLDMAKVPRGGLVFDPYMGSGSTGVACAKTGPRFVGCEIDPRYFDIACRRIEDAQRTADMFGHDPRDAYEKHDQQSARLEGFD